MSDTRDRVMRNWPGVTVIDLTVAHEQPGFSSPPQYLVFDRRLIDDPAVTTTQRNNRNSIHTNTGVIASAIRNNLLGDTMLGWWFLQSQATIDSNYP